MTKENVIIPEAIEYRIALSKFLFKTSFLTGISFVAALNGATKIYKNVECYHAVMCGDNRRLFLSWPVVNSE